MSFDAKRLFDLLPAIDRIRDDAEGGPLKELLSVIAGQIGILEENLDQLYDDQFIETCAEWVVPYIGDLIGYRSLHGVAPRISSPRAEVAHTIGFRRRKGTASMLEQLARDVTDWDANVVEYFLRLGVTQYMNHIRPSHWYAPDLRHWEPVERISTPFDSTAHTIDVRRIETGQGLFNIQNIGLWLWRLDAYPLTESPAVKIDDRRYRFSPLGNDSPLFTNPVPEPEISHLAEPVNVPAPIGRRVLDRYLHDYYGPTSSLFITHDGNDVAVDDIVAANLSDAGGGGWAHRPKDKIAVDPVLGRIAFPEDQNPPRDVLVTYHYGFAKDMSGGEYPRLATFDPLLQPVPVPPPATLQDSLDAARGGGAVEIAGSGRYEESLSIAVDAKQTIEFRAADKSRPTLILGADLEITGGAESEVTLNGLLISGGALRVSAAAENKLKTLRLRHCTLVPGLALTGDGAPAHPDQPSLIVELPDLTVEIDHCIIGGLRVDDDANVVICDSIVDATDDALVAYAGLDGDSPGGQLQVINTTLIGKIRTVLLEYASNSIFLARLADADTWAQAVRSERKQTGCVRFSFLDLSASVPRRRYCQPDLEIAGRIAEKERDGPPLSAMQKAMIESDVVSWLRPRLVSTRYGDPGYGQLHVTTPCQIRTGADDEAEMGAMHDLFAPQRETNLRIRLDEYLRFGLEAGIFYAT